MTAISIRPALAIRTLKRPELAVLLVLAAALNLWALDQNGWANEYYSAAIKSMASSWHNFLYGSFDASGVMTVDQPPLALWVQTLSVKVFGFSSLAILVPQALMGMASVALVYDLTRRRFGRAAGGGARGGRRGGARARAHADDGGDLASQQPRRAARALLGRRALVRRAGARGRAHEVARLGRHVRRARVRDEDARGADGRAGHRRRVAVDRAARSGRGREVAARGRRGDGARRPRLAASRGADAGVG